MPEKKIGDWDEATARVIGTVGAANTAAGIWLVANSELVHLIVGAYCIASGLFLLGWLRFRVIGTRDEPRGEH